MTASDRLLHRRRSGLLPPLLGLLGLVACGGGLAQGSAPESASGASSSPEAKRRPARTESFELDNRLPRLSVNQHGYLPGLSKVGVLLSDSTQPLRWRLLAAGGAAVAEGETRAYGPDLHSGQAVHQIDFSGYQTPGAGYTLEAGGEQSHPFEISYSIYARLKKDALSYFYHNRSGIAVEMPYCDQEQWARPAGHLPDMAHCASGTGCDYTLNVSKGWYDAGDHGKYVVNGGIATWTLLNQYERAIHLGCSECAFEDGSLRIPERHNNVADLLDEARWELEFLLAMQVPPGHPLSDMVHHKMHDQVWTQLGLRPDQDTVERVLRPPSTAATLNLAAVAAQAARLFSQTDGVFAAHCLEAAQRAFSAAMEHPARYAPASDNVGGGPYDDDYVSDEFYWAAAELFVTTGQPKYLDALESNPHHWAFLRGTGTKSAMSWNTVDTLGVVSLAMVPSRLASSQRQRLRGRLIELADAYLANIDSQGYRTPFRPAKAGYPWGSNSLVLTNAVFLALAYDFTQQQRYLFGVGAAMDYILGTNPLGQSYVTGYGEQAIQNPHHRFWAPQARAGLPPPPPGVLSGGPNSGLQDPHAKAAGLQGCAPQQCFVDHSNAWSVNEVAINWNAPLAWVSAFLDEQGQRSAASSRRP